MDYAGTKILGSKNLGARMGGAAAAHAGTKIKPDSKQPRAQHVAQGS